MNYFLKYIGSKSATNGFIGSYIQAFTKACRLLFLCGQPFLQALYLLRHLHLHLHHLHFRLLTVVHRRHLQFGLHRNSGKQHCYKSFANQHKMNIFNLEWSFS